jgi:DNA-binding beta-propeller fold protein YncE
MKIPFEKQVTKRQVKLFLRVLLVCLFFLIVGENAFAQGEAVPVELIKMLTLDDRGKPLSFPSAVFFDKNSKEIYIINGGRGRIVIFGPGPAYLPMVSVGPGRKVDSPAGISVDNDGRLYVCQTATDDHPARLTILNGALLVENEITFDGIALEEKIIPHRAVVGKNGLIYLSSQTIKGILILDDKGNFLRRLIPMINEETGEIVATQDRIISQKESSPQTDKAQQQQSSQSEPDDVSGLAGLPPELRPKIKTKSISTEQATEIKPVPVKEIVIDQNGLFYLLSEEYSKVFVYSPDEKFLYAFGQKGGGPKKLSRPRSVALDEKKQWAYVVDYMRHTILVYDLREKGKFLFEIGGRGIGPGWFNFPASAAVSNEGYLIVGDYFNQRVQILNVKMEYGVVGPIIK